MWCKNTSMKLAEYSTRCKSRFLNVFYCPGNTREKSQKIVQQKNEENRIIG